MSEKVSKRLFIGGLTSTVTEDDIKERFAKFGSIDNLSLKIRTDEQGVPVKTFAHLDISGEETNIKKCFNAYQNTKWKGLVLKLQYAKESFIQKLEQERATLKENRETFQEKPEQAASKPLPVIPEIKGSAVPGTPVPGKTDWIVGKYGRVLPVLKLKKSYKIKMVKHDPSKHCHAAKVFKDDDKANVPLNTSCDKLTWEINTPDTEVSKKRKGDFPDTPKLSKVKKVETPAIKKLPPKAEPFEVVKTAVTPTTVQNHRVTASQSNKQVRPAKSVFDSSGDEMDDDDVQRRSPNVKGSVPVTNGMVGGNKGSAVIKNQNISTTSGGAADCTSNKEPPAGSRNLKVNQSSKNTNIINSDNFPTNKAGIPEFRGLGMLLGLDSTSSHNSLEKSKESLPPSTPSTTNSSNDNVRNAGQMPDRKPTPKTPRKEKVASPKLSSPNASINSSKGSSETMNEETPKNTNCFKSEKDKSSSKTKKEKVQVMQQQESKTDVDKTSDDKTNREKVSVVIDKVKGEGSNTPAANKDKTASKTVQGKSNTKKELVLRENCDASSKRKTAKQTQDKVENKDKTAKQTQGKVEDKDKTPSKMLQEKTTKKKQPIDNNVDKGYDSASSANTDEIIAICKKKLVKSTPSNSPCPTLASTTQTLQPKHSTPNSSKLDQSLLLSEFTAGTVELSDYSLPNTTPAHQVTDYDSYDSELDSNDFELVAKKLAQKAQQPKNITTLKTRHEFGKLQSLSSAVVNRRELGTSRSSDEKKAQKPCNQEPSDVSVFTQQSSVQQKLLGISGTQASTITSVNKTVTDSWKSAKIETAKPSAQSERQPVSDKKKQLAANEKRLLALKEKMNEKQQQQKLVHKALHMMDSQEGKSSKRIVFSSDDENDNDDEEDSSSDDSESDTDNDDEKEKKKKKEVSLEKKSQAKTKVKSTEKVQDKKKLTLFEDSSDESGDEGCDYDELFKSKPQFEGKKGEKLMKLERKIGDSRFKLDAKFAESDTDDDDDKESDMEMTKGRFSDKKDETETGRILQEEKTASLKVLENVVGKTTLDRFSAKIKRNTIHLIDMKAVRFDPTKMMPEIEEKKMRASTSESKTKTKVSSSDEPIEKKKKVAEEIQQIDLKRASQTEEDHGKSPGTSKSQVQLSSTLVNLFKKNKAEDKSDTDKNQPFSLLKQFDENDDEDHRNREEGNETKSSPPLAGLFKEKAEREAEVLTPSQPQSLLPGELSGESAMSEEDGESEEESSSTEEPVVSDDTDIKEVDKELQEAGKVDVRYTKDQWLSRWEEIRPNLVKMFKKKHKDALKNKRTQNEMKRKKDFLKNSRKKQWNKKK